MLTQQEREEIRHGIENAARYGDGDGPTADALRAWGKVAVRDAPRLLAALEDAEKEIVWLNALVSKLYGLVDSVSVTRCEHKCLTKKTGRHFLPLLEEARAVVEHGKAN